MSRALPMNPPAQVFDKFLDEAQYLCSIRTLHLLLAERGEAGERRVQRPKTHYPVPRLVAQAPKGVWTCWDITKLATSVKGAFLSLYVVLDLSPLRSGLDGGRTGE